MKNLITSIQKVKVKGKWIEFWYEEAEDNIPVADRPFDICSKYYMLQDIIEKDGLGDEILTNGLQGRRLEWEKVGPNYEIKGFFSYL